MGKIKEYFFSRELVNGEFVLDDEKYMQDVVSQCNPRYEAKSFLWLGSQAINIRVRDKNLLIDKVLKIPRPDLNDEYKKMIIRGVRHLVNVNMSNGKRFFRNVHGIFFNPFFVEMQYIPGVTLRTWVEDSYRYNLETGLDIFREILEATTKLHSAKDPIIHRDLRPDNIIITPNNTVRVIDFGFATTHSDRNLIIEKSLGNPYYASPEQLKNPNISNPSTDIFSLAQVLWFIIFKQELEPGEHRPDKFLDWELDNRLPGLYSRATLENPGERYQNGKELLNEFNKIYPPSIAKFSPEKKGILDLAEELFFLFEGDFYFASIFLQDILPPKKLRKLWKDVCHRRIEKCIFE